MILSRILSRIVGEKMIWMIICRFPRAITKKTEPSIMRATPDWHYFFSFPSR